MENYVCAWAAFTFICVAAWTYDLQAAGITRSCSNSVWSLIIAILDYWWSTTGEVFLSNTIIVCTLVKDTVNTRVHFLPNLPQFGMAYMHGLTINLSNILCGIKFPILSSNSALCTFLGNYYIKVCVCALSWTKLSPNIYLKFKNNLCFRNKIWNWQLYHIRFS